MMQARDLRETAFPEYRPEGCYRKLPLQMRHTGSECKQVFYASRLPRAAAIGTRDFPARIVGADYLVEVEYPAFELFFVFQRRTRRCPDYQRIMCIILSRPHLLCRGQPAVNGYDDGIFPR
jgi:hypothetical protein